MELLRRVSEGLARTTSRRGFFGRGAEVATGALLGAAVGTLTRPNTAGAGGTVCGFPGPPCTCGNCTAGGTCAKPCIFTTNWYPSGCWNTAGTTCCDCSCPDIPSGTGWCGCGSDYHNNPNNCP